MNQQGFLWVFAVLLKLLKDIVPLPTKFTVLWFTVLLLCRSYAGGFLSFNINYLLFQSKIDILQSKIIVYIFFFSPVKCNYKITDYFNC